MSQLVQIQEWVRLRAAEICRSHADWPCRKGCDDCCRHLAATPWVSHAEWLLIEEAIAGLPAETAELVRQRIRASETAVRPVVCPLLNTSEGTCLVYEARPVACRTYGFYADGAAVLGCNRIEAIGRERPDIVWGNHGAIEDRLGLLGRGAALFEWLAGDEEPTG